jgi:hypothetical protein
MPIPDPPPRPSHSWGKIRDALAAVHNLETLLKSPRVGASVLAALLPELRASCATLRGAFTADTRGAKAHLSEFASERLDALEQALTEAGATDIEARERLALEQVVARVSGELDAAVELLDLIERAEAAVPTEHALEELTRASLVIGSSLAQSEEVTVRLDTSDAGCTVVADAHVVSRILALAMARVRGKIAAAGPREVAVRARCQKDTVTITVSPIDGASAILPAVVARFAQPIEPGDAIVEAAARAVRGSVTHGDVVTITLPRGS